MFPQKTCAPAGVVVTRATQSRDFEVPIGSAGAVAAAGDGAVASTRLGAPTTTATFAFGRSAIPSHNPTSRQIA